MNAQLGADVVRTSFIAVDFHHLLLAGLPAHSAQYPSTGQPKLHGAFGSGAGRLSG